MYRALSVSHAYAHMYRRRSIHNIQLSHFPFLKASGFLTKTLLPYIFKFFTFGLFQKNVSKGVLFSFELAIKFLPSGNFTSIGLFNAINFSYILSSFTT